MGAPGAGPRLTRAAPRHLARKTKPRRCAACGARRAASSSSRLSRASATRWRRRCGRRAVGWRPWRRRAHAAGAKIGALEMASMNTEVFSAVKAGGEALKVNQQDIDRIDDVMGDVQEQVRVPAGARRRAWVGVCLLTPAAADGPGQRGLDAAGQPVWPARRRHGAARQGRVPGVSPAAHPAVAAAGRAGGGAGRPRVHRPRGAVRARVLVVGEGRRGPMAMARPPAC